MATSSSKSAFLEGAQLAAPFILVIGPFGMLFGVLGTEAGLDIAAVMGFSVIVVAGAAQFTALQLMQDEAPTLIVLATALAVNLRMAMYSASITPYLGPLPFWKRAIAAYFLVDQAYALSQLRYEADPEEAIDQKFAFFLGTALPIAPFWYGCTWLGAVLGTAIPPEYALDFAVPITFLALIGPALRTLAHVAAAVTSVVGTLLLAGMPYGTGLLVAAVLGMIAGALTETWVERHA